MGSLWIGYGKSESAGFHRIAFGRASRRTGVSNYGVRASCPAFIREFNAARTANRCCIWTTQLALAARCVAVWLDAIDEINRQTYAAFGNPETITRVAQYELAFRMQMDATDAMDIGKEPASVRAKYGSKPGDGKFCQQLFGGAAPGGARCALHSALSLGMGFPRAQTLRKR